VIPSATTLAFPVSSIPSSIKFAEWIFTDAGEPGTSDTATIKVTIASGSVVLNVSGKLQVGNQQALTP